MQPLYAALFMAGGYGIMCSVCQSTAILLAGPERRGLANSTYYIRIVYSTRTRATAALVLVSCLILLFSHLSIRPLHRIRAVFAVAFDRVNLVFLCRPVFEELQGHLREEGVA